jgi:hypothetical protein
LLEVGGMMCFAGARRALRSPGPARWPCLALLLSLLVSGCLQTEWPDEVVSDEANVEGSVLDRAEHYRDFERVTAKAYGSELGDFDIDVFVNGSAAALYEQITPEAPGSRVLMPVGTIIVREVHDAAGNVEKLTIMAKAPRGYSTEMGDWWWAVTDPDGVPLEEDGKLLKGRMPECWSCHLERAQDDFLFGVPAAVQ